MPYLAHSLRALRNQVNGIAPNRSKRSDGWIGDRKHARRESDHNPNFGGAVRAIDITHDPRNGMDCYVLSEQLRISKDPRLSYVIFDGRWFRAYRKWDYQKPFVWIPYKGKNPYTKHMHVSVHPAPQVYDDDTEWVLHAQPIQKSWRDRRKERKVNIVKYRDKGKQVREIQQLLSKHGHGKDVGVVDGIYGKRTRAAVVAFQHKWGLKATGDVDGITMGFLVL